MVVSKLQKNPNIYTCFSYYIRGDWNKLGDENTLIDVGMDDYIYDEIQGLPIGIGNKLVSKIILTHEHFDHSSGVAKIKEKTGAKVYAFKKNDYVDVTVRNYMKLNMGDSEALILHTPGHSEDSICIYFQKEKTLFTGDTPIDIKSPGGNYTEEFAEVLLRLSRLEVDIIYPGHNKPITNNISGIFKNSISNVEKSVI